MTASWAFILDSVPFSRKVIDGHTSLGGSESSCLGVARALAHRGADVHVFATKMTVDAPGADNDGVVWHPIEDFPSMNAFIEWDVVVALRAFSFYGNPVHARCRILWNQDLMVPGDMAAGVMSVAWAYDLIAYVSDYHRRQWEDLQPELTPIGWATRNGFDPAQLPASSTKDPNRIIHISRPERGLRPILAMWPALKERFPHATLQICRYSSMYDQGKGSWSDVCASFDRQIDQVNQAVGGITYLGELTKPQLYQAVSDAAVMWYPGVNTFAETSCIAAIESQGCGTPFVGSLKGALPETAKPSFDAGLLIAGDADQDPTYHAQSIAAVGAMLDGCKRNTVAYRKLQDAGRAHVTAYTYDGLAAEWETKVTEWFAARYETRKLGVLRQLLHEDDHCGAKIVANDILDGYGDSAAAYTEAHAAFEFCERVIDGKEQSAAQYSEHAIQDPLAEAELCGRFHAAIPEFAGCTRVLDVACGNGSFAIALARANPTVHITGLDYSAGNITLAQDGAVRAGVADRCTFHQVTVYDFDAHTLHAEWTAWTETHGDFDGLFVGEFVEHVASTAALVDGLEAVLRSDAPVVYTCPIGPFTDMAVRTMAIHRGHVHLFHHDDVRNVWSKKKDFSANYLPIGITQRGAPIGHWLIAYRVAPNRPAGSRDFATRIGRTRPKAMLSVGLITKDAENDLGRCLTSLWGVADEIVIGDTGSTDHTKAIAADYRATILDLAPIMEQPEGFSGARNAVLKACTGDWFLWIDADEILLGSHLLRRYLEGPIFNGFVLHQTHLHIDAAPTFDIPVRVFRTAAPIQFYGCVHEQPALNDCNGDVVPTLETYDVLVAHTGYLTENVRREKMLNRNLPLLRKDQEVFPTRELGKVLVMRDYVNLADFDREGHQGQMTARARAGYAQAVRLFLTHFDDPAHRYHAIARPWYETALQHLGQGWEMELAAAGKAGGMGAKRAETERLWVRDAGEFMRLQAYRSQKIAAGMITVPMKTDPFPARQCEGVAA
jgi:glycosyltransferase involved in cell wall biosynthesis/2-polyprenyl-3-methyl-5-hydroxy-6-metoxy-1,4-benzoquinol methylase